jgi:outer membrane protein TolC
MLTAALALTGAGLSAQTPPAQTSEARIQELIRKAAERVASGQTTVQPTGTGTGQPPGTMQTNPAAGDTRPVLSLTLDDAVKAALEHNLDITVQRLNPAINDIAIASLRSIYHPSLTSQLGTQSQTSPSTSTISGGTAGQGVNTGLATYNGGIAQNIPWGGGGFNVALNNNRTTTTNSLTLYNPAYNTNWSAQYSQPLLRGFRTDSTRQQLAVTKINRDISDVQLRATITNTLSNVRNAYWDYVFAVQAVDVARQSLDLAGKLVADNQTRVEVGTMAPIDVVSAQSEAATRRQVLVSAESTRRTAELALKRLIVAGTGDPAWSASIDPIDRPDFRPEAVDIEGAVRRALSERTDIDIARKNIEANGVTLKYLTNQLLPQADVVAQYGVVGLGGTQFVTSGTGLNRTIIGTVPGGYGDAITSMFHPNYPRWTVSLNLSYPLGTSAQEASVARARVQLNQVDAQLKQVELQVATDVTNAALTAQSNAEGVQAAQAARELSQKKLEAEQSKFEVGMSTNYFVVQAQRDLSDARNTELRAILNYRKSLVELERLQQTTLQSLSVTLLNAGGTGTGSTVGTTATGATGGTGGATGMAGTTTTGATGATVVR